MGVAMIRSKGGAGPRDANQTPNQRKKRSRDSERERERDFTDLLATVRRPATGVPVPARRPPRRGGQRKPPPQKKEKKKTSAASDTYRSAVQSPSAASCVWDRVG